MKVSETGQITIPRDVLEELGLEPGAEVEIVAKGGVVVVRAVDAVTSAEKFKRALQCARGSADTGLSTDEIMSMTRGED